MVNAPMINTGRKNELIGQWMCLDDSEAIQDAVRSYMIDRYPALEVVAFAELDLAVQCKVYQSLNSCVCSFKSTDAAKALPRAKFELLHARLLFPEQYQMHLGKAASFVKLIIDTKVQDFMHAAIIYAVETGNRPLAYATLSYGMCSRGKLLRPGELRKIITDHGEVDHVNAVSDLRFAGERILVLYPEKMGEGEYFKIALLDNELMQKAWHVLYSEPATPNLNKLAIAELKKFEFDGEKFDVLVRADREFTFRHLRNLGLTMLTRVWDYESGGDYQGDLEFVMDQAHHKCEDTSKIYRASTVLNEIDFRGKVFSHIKKYELFDDCADEPDHE